MSPTSKCPQPVCPLLLLSRPGPLPTSRLTLRSARSSTDPASTSIRDLKFKRCNTTNSFSEPNTRRQPITAPATSTPATLTILLAPVRFYDDGCETSLHLAVFDALGAFSSALYATNRLIERSRSRTRERKMAMKSHRSSSNYYRYQQQALLQQQ